jgi:long-chain acyl-CoA synthetase
MARDTLLDFFEDFSHSSDTFIVHDDGYRVREATYAQVATAAREFARRLTEAGVGPDDKVVIWSENRIEWVVAFWGTLLGRAVLVPVDFRASADLLLRISRIVAAKVVLAGDQVEVPADTPGEVWKLADVITLAGGLSTAASGSAAAEGHRHPQAPAPLTGSSLAQIIFTSGATAEPKGVTITHRNVLANIIPIEREIGKYKRYARPFHPIRFLNLLPLSHMFGQSMATFIPPMLAGTVVFSHGYSPVEIIHQIKSRRVSVLVCVPKVLDVLRDYVQRTVPLSTEPDPLVGKHWSRRWWHYRDVHRLFGWKFWCVVCGAAPLDPELEAFWRKLGLLVVQGYGLTETAPVVTLNHPLRASKGTVGRPIGGVEVRIADDGEILVRGENVTKGYYKPAGTEAAGAAESDSPFKDGWFHTGDIGELDATGRLAIKGRKKEMIVTPQGLNVFPEDVERALLAQPGVREAGVVGLAVHGEERIHAVLVVEPGRDVEAIVRGANAGLEDHQRVWSTSIWPGALLPRTEGTKKLKRRDLQRWAAGEAVGAASGPMGAASVADVVARFSAGRTIGPETTLEEIGLSSLDRVGLMMALEEAFQTTLDEAMLTGPRTIRELEQLVAPAPAVPAAERADRAGTVHATATPAAPLAIDFPSWNRTRLSWFVRRISLPTWILPLARAFVDLRVEGLDHLTPLSGPVVFAANHQSHMDTPVIMLALPARFRYHLAPAMAKEFFKAHFNPETVSRKAWCTNSLNYYLSCQFFNAFPLPQREAGTRQTLRYIGDVIASGYSVLIFPEGRRNDEGHIERFMPGVGMIGSRLDIPVVPVRIEGLNAVLHRTMKFPKRGPVRVAFGAPIRLSGEDYPALAARVEAAVRGL